MPISLLACITETSAVSSVSASRSALGRDDAGRVDRQQRGRPAAAGQRLERVQHRFVLDGAGNQVASPGRLERLGGAADREVVGLGAAAREDDFRRLGADQSAATAVRASSRIALACCPK